MEPISKSEKEEIAAVSATIDILRAAGKAGDLDKFMDNFVDDAIWMLDDRYQDANKDEAREYFGFLKNSSFDQLVSKDEIQICGDWVGICKSDV